MKRFYKFLMPLVAIVALALPWNVGAQTLTVADGTATDEYVPIYGYYCDAEQHNQMLYPADMLDSMDGSYITSLTFYQSQAASSSWGTTVTIKMLEVTDSVITSGHLPTTGATTVWTGTVNGTTSTLNFVLTTPFAYNGGNLLVDITTTEGDYSRSYFYGIVRTGASYYDYDYDYDVEDFLPKATFGYTTGSVCIAPTNFTAATAGDTATFNWVAGDGTAWEIVWGSTGFNPDNESTNIDYPTDTTFELTGLADGFYQAYIRTDCGSSDYSMWIGPLNFNIGITVMNMATSGSDTLRSCSAIIYDDGGPTGSYSSGISLSTLVIYPADDQHAVVISGNSYTEGSWDYLRIYEGVGTTGDEVWSDYDVSATQTFGPFISTSAFTVTFHSDGNVQYAGFEIDVSCVELSNCLPPAHLAVNAAAADSVLASWNTTDDGASTAWQLAVAPTGFNPDTVDADSLFSVTDSNVVLTTLMSGITYDMYVRTDCGSEQSYWIGPVTFTPGAINMAPTGNATMYVCNAAIFDDGGSTGNYSSYCNSTLTLYPNDDTKRFKFWGSGYTESCCDYLRVYAGAAVGGTLLASIQGTATIDTVTTQGGPITLQFYSDGSLQYDGFEFHVMCEDLPPCRDVEDVTVVEVSATSAYVTWRNAVGTTPLPSSYVVTVTDSTGATVTTETATEMFAMVGGMSAFTEYTVTVVPACDESNGMPASAVFTTADYPCLVFDTTGAGAPYQVGDGDGTSYYLPVGNFYNYSYTQQLFEASEMNGAMPITGIDFEYGYSSPSTDKTNVTIYLANTSATSLSSSFVPYDATTFVPVYTGNLNGTMGWNHYAFDSAFYYDGVSNLLVVVHDNSGDYNGSSYVFKTHPTTGKGRYVNNDNSPYTLATVSGGTALSYRANTRFSTFGCAQPATCAAPLMVVTGKSESSVSIMWAAGGSEASWNVDYRAIDTNDWTTVYSNTTLTDATITDLQPNTTYLFRVYHVCSTDTFATVRTVTTDCAGATVPFFENFASWATGTSAAVPSCWFKGSNYSDGYPYVTTGNSMSGDNNSMYFYASGTTRTYLALPKMEAPLDTLVVTGYVKYSSNGYYLNIGMVTDVQDFSTYHPAGGVSTVANQWVPFEVSFAGMPDGNIVFYTGNGGSSAYLYLDNISVNYFNPCVRPSNVTTTGITTNSALLHWTDTATTNVEVEYGPAGFIHGTGTTVSATGDTLTLTGLLHSSLYDVYVRGICGAGDTSDWSFVHTFATSCAPIDVLPFTENFDNWGTGSSVHAPNCWTYGSNYSTTYPYINSITGHGGAMYMYDGSSAGSTNKTWFALPEIDSTVAQVNQTQVTFEIYRSTTSYEHPVMVGVGNNPTIDTTIVWIDTVYPVYNEWNEHEVAFDTYTGNGRYIFFATNIAGSYAYSYPYIDNITLEMIPSCQRPNQLTASNATPTSVDLSWNERSGATQWQIEYGPQGFTPGTGTVVTVTANPYTLTGLTPGFQGQFLVRSICSAADTGNYSREIGGFATSQIPATLPYNYDFEDGAEWNNWQVSSNDATRNWYRGTSVADSGSYSMYVATGDSASYFSYAFDAVVNAAAYRDVDFGPIDSSYTLSFRARVGGTTTARYDAMMVFLVDPSLPTTPTSSNITSPWGNVNNLYRIATVYLDTTWQTYEASFDTIHGIHRVAFFWFNQNTGASYANIPQPAAVDNIHIAYATCPRPVDLEVVNVTDVSATLTWTAEAGANYEIAYREVGGTNQFITATTNSVTIGGLTPNGDYRAWVRKLCGVGDTSLWSDGVAFNTALCAGGTEATNFDPTASATTSSYSPIGYATYNYSYVQTIIDSADLASLGGDITAFAFLPTNTTSSDYYTNITMYMANVSESNLTNNFIMPDSTNHVFVKVIDSANFNFTTTDWQIHNLDTAFTWDGHSNLLIAVNREHGSWSSSTSFSAHTASVAKMRYVYQDSGPYNINTVSGGYSSTAVGDIRLISCASSCAAPAVVSIQNDYQSATITVAGGSDYDLVYGTDIAAMGDTMNNTTGIFNISGLMPATQYFFGVRQHCDSVTVSNWYQGSFTTDSLPCFVPENVTVEATTFNSATISWSSNATAWELHVVGAGLDSVYAATTNPFVIGGLYQGTQYNVSVRSICMAGVEESDYSDPITVTTNACNMPEGVTVSNVTYQSAEVSWQAVSGAQGYNVYWGEPQFYFNLVTPVPVTGTSYTITGLEAESPYEVVVVTRCTESLEASPTDNDRIGFTTGQAGIYDVESGTLTLYPNPATTSVSVNVTGMSGNVTLQIVDMNGRTVYSQSGSNEFKIDVSSLAQGAYFVRVTSEQQTAVRKLIVK